MGRSGEGDRGDEARQDCDFVRHHQFYPRTHRRVQDAEVRRLPRGAAAQSLRQDIATELARSVLGGEGPAGELAPRRSYEGGGSVGREREREREREQLNASLLPYIRTGIPPLSASGFPRCPR